MLDDDAQRLLEHVLVDVLGAQQEQRARPVDRLGDRGRLLQVQAAHHLHDLDQLARHLLVQLGRVQAHDLQLALHVGVVEPQVEAAALERLGQLARVVRGQQHQRAACGPPPRPARGSRPGSRTGPRAASPRTPGRSCRSRRSAAPPAPPRRWRASSGRGSRNSSPKMSSRTSRQPASSPPPGCAGAACGSSTRTAPWPRPGPRSTAGARACGPVVRASALASSVLPTPAGPSTSTGLPSCAAR